MKKFLLAAILIISFTANSASAAPKWARIGNGGDFAHSALIGWATDTQCAGKVQYGLDQNYGMETPSVSRPFAEWGVLHEAELKNLQPDSVYHYRVGCDTEGYAGDFWFKTAPEGECFNFKFAVAGDSRGEELFGFYQPSFTWPGVLSEVQTVQPAFVFNTGDLVRDGAVAGQWVKFMEQTVPYWHTAPLFWTLGNHDNDSFDGPDAMPNLLQLAPKNQSSLSEDFYSFDYGLGHFVVLSTETYNDNSSKIQTDWLEADLAATRKPWKIVFFHRPYYTFGNHVSNEDNKSGPFMPAIEARGVDLVIVGHNHNYELFNPIKNGQVVDYGEGPVHVTAGCGGALQDSIYAFRNKDLQKLNKWKVEFGFVEVQFTAQFAKTTMTFVYHKTAAGNLGGQPESNIEFSYSKPLPTNVCPPPNADGDAETVEIEDSDDEPAEEEAAAEEEASGEEDGAPEEEDQAEEEPEETAAIEEESAEDETNYDAELEPALEESTDEDASVEDDAAFEKAEKKSGSKGGCGQGGAEAMIGAAAAITALASSRRRMSKR